jgi:hypothetical protein
MPYREKMDRGQRVFLLSINTKHTVIMAQQ